MTSEISGKVYDLLIKKGLVSEEDLKKAREVCSKEGGKLGDILVRMGVVTKENLLTALSEGLGFPLIDLSRFHITEETLNLIPKKIALQYQILPVSRIGHLLTIAMVDPLNIFALDDIKAITKMKISPVLAGEDDIREALSKCYEKSADQAINEIVDNIETASMEMVSEKDEGISSGDLLRIAEEVPVVKFTNLILSRAVKDRSSDILIEPMEGNSRVRYRIDGVLTEAMFPPKKFHHAIISRLKVMSNLNIAERRLPQDGRFRIKIEGRYIDFRISTIPSCLGEKVALRILDKQQAMIDLDKLGFKERDKERLREASEKPHGMILVCGPTGCGKTTTLYSILKHVDDPGKNLVTVEDPVEYELKGINQVSVIEEIGLTFAGCLRSILRQDPDVIMVGEIRDFDTVDIAIKSALTGHMVLSTLHTNTAAGSIVRMINMGVEPFLIAASVELIAAQRLVRVLCPECKESYIPDREIAERYKLFDKSGNIATIFKPKGCKRCINTGYKGRVGLIECIKMTPKVRDNFYGEVQENTIKRIAREEGMVTLRESGIENVIHGVTSLEEVLRTTVEDRDGN